MLPAAGEPVSDGGGAQVRVRPGSKGWVGEPGAEVNSLVITDDFTWVMVGRQDRADQAEGG